MFERRMRNLIWDGRRRKKHTPRRFLMRNKKFGQDEEVKEKNDEKEINKEANEK